MMTLAYGAFSLTGRCRPLNAAVFLRVATPEDNVAVATTPIRRPDLFASVVNSRLKFWRRRLIFCECARLDLKLDSRVTVTYLTEPSHYLTQRQVFPYLGAMPIAAAIDAGVPALIFKD